MKAGEERLGKLEKRDLPLFYRLVLKIPLPRLDALPDAFHGVFWAIIVPIFIVLVSILSLLSLSCIPFPTNMVLLIILPSIVFLIFLRIMVENFVTSWNALISEPSSVNEPVSTSEPRSEWNQEKLIDEYISDILKKRESEKKR